MAPEQQPDCVGLLGFWLGHRFSEVVYDPTDKVPIGMVCTRCGLYSGSDRVRWKTTPTDGKGGERVDNG